MMKASIAEIGARFNSDRMVTEYVEKLYVPAHERGEAALAEGLRGLLRRQRVDVDPGSELETGEHRQAGEQLEVPVRAVVEPRVQRHRALDGVQPADGLARRPSAEPRSSSANPSDRVLAGAITHSYGSRLA